MNKTWWEVRVTVDDPKQSRPMKNELLAKVKSEGLAQLVKQKFQEVYGESAKIVVC